MDDQNMDIWWLILDSSHSSKHDKNIGWGLYGIFKNQQNALNNAKQNEVVIGFQINMSLPKNIEDVLYIFHCNNCSYNYATIPEPSIDLWCTATAFIDKNNNSILMPEGIYYNQDIAQTLIGINEVIINLKTNIRYKNPPIYTGGQ